jgi:hypothetical protein
MGHWSDFASDSLGAMGDFVTVLVKVSPGFLEESTPESTGAFLFVMDSFSRTKVLWLPVATAEDDTITSCGS